MKICYVNPTNNIRRPIAELSNILAEQGHEITIMYPNSKECPTKNWVANDAVKNGNIKLLPIKSWYFAPLRYSFPNLIDLCKATKKVYKENQKVHIWEYYYPISIVPLLYDFLKGPQKQKKTILTTDGFVGYSYKPKNPWWLVPAFKIYTQLFARFLFKIPGTMTTYGNPMIPYAKQAGVPMKKLRIIPTGIHLDRFQNVDVNVVEKLKKEFGIKDEKVILYAGMLTERKGIRKVIQVSFQLLDEGYNIKTLLVGDAHGENIYAKLVRPDYKEKIIFTGGRKEIPEFMKLANVLLLPSEGEGLPGVVMEAMASGLPVVATNEGCTSDLIEDGVEGFLVDWDDDEEGGYYEKVKKIISKNKSTRDFSTKALNKIQEFEWKVTTTKYRELYQKNENPSRRKLLSLFNICSKLKNTTSRGILEISKTNKNINELTKNKFNEEVKRWEGVHQKIPKNIIEWEVFKRKEITKKFISKNFKGKHIKILEIGCGSGNNIEEIINIDKNWEGKGVDISPEMIHFCDINKKRPKLSFELLNIDNNALNQKFDIIILLGVVGYLDNLKKSFSNILKMLENDGHLIFTYGNKQSLFRKIRLMGEFILSSKKVAKLVYMIKKRIFGIDEFLISNEKNNFFKLYSFKQIKYNLEKEKIIKKYNLCFGSGITGSLFLPLSNCIEKKFKTKDVFSLGMTNLLIVKKK